ncbi:microcystin degradation protein MlrC [Stella humosa]|uniref:Microcystinase C n=1 Tax=Stella humosa TaxID=94 RepID=A0A3N1L290_9PROT|nr:M81 family metallopeptidase [Stella humosa]ROP84708.1 microcystin degradation protein MlrC [Stella humosa]BBK34228.1 microcystinase C [Stella humosa]
MPPASPNAANPRIAILGIHHEGSRFAPPLNEADTREWGQLDGAEMWADANAARPRSMGGLWGFVRAMNVTGPWTPVPITYLDCGAAGAIEHGWYVRVRDEMRRQLEAAMPVDGVYFPQHGASITTEELDPDGELFQMARDIVGPGVPIVATLDLHANVSDRMVQSTDLLVAYRTNPHTDQSARGREAAMAMRELLAGLKTEHHFIRLPLMAPQVSQLTAAGPYAEIIAYGQTKVDETVMNVSILGGFTYGDTPDQGMAFIVTTRGDAARARDVCKELAGRVWRYRERFLPKLTGLDECVARAVAVGRDRTLAPICIADVADNPGGGARGNTTWLLEALHASGAEGVVLGVFTDPPLAAEAHRLGSGATFTAHFNRDETQPLSRPFQAQATVVGLSDGVFPGAVDGSAAGTMVDLGPTAALQVGNVTVIVITRRQQCIDPGYIEHVGVPLTAARTVIVKSRGHFRAGFLRLFQPEQVIEADVPGLTSPNLGNFDFRSVPRPIYPLDMDADWTPPN